MSNYILEVQDLIKQYKQSILKSAFEGKLCKAGEWEENFLEKIATKITDGSHFSPKAIDKVKNVKYNECVRFNK